jgi:3',5'-cyclic AMP phosphodiesterase CpdA
LLAHIASDPSAEYQKQLADAIFNSWLQNVANDGKSLDRLKTALLNQDGKKWALDCGDSKLFELYNALSQNHTLIASLQNFKQDTIRSIGLHRLYDISTVDNISIIKLNYSTLVANAKNKLEYPH